MQTIPSGQSGVWEETGACVIQAAAFQKSQHDTLVTWWGWTLCPLAQGRLGLRKLGVQKGPQSLFMLKKGLSFKNLL